MCCLLATIPHNVFSLQKVDVLVYINGGTRVDEIWYARYCSWKEGGFPYDTYAPVTIKVGGEVVSKSKIKILEVMNEVTRQFNTDKS